MEERLLLLKLDRMLSILHGHSYVESRCEQYEYQFQMMIPHSADLPSADSPKSFTGVAL